MSELRTIDTSDRPFGLPDLITIVVDLPFPPSVNRIWRSNARSVTLSPEYRRWKDSADMLTIASRVYRRMGHISGSFEAYIALNVDRGRGDIDNRIKAVMDWAQSRSLIANDKHCRRLTVEWVDHANAPDGCRLTLREMLRGTAA